MKTTNNIIEQIHHEASTAEQSLLNEASRILKQASDKQTVERINELQKLGFTHFKEAVELSPEQVQRVRELKELISIYRIKAPTTKFMTDEAVKELCVKYGLVQAPVSCYVDRIPEKNQQEILEFKLDDELLQNSFMNTVEVGEVNFSLNQTKIKTNFAKKISSKRNVNEGHECLKIVEFIVNNWDDNVTRDTFGRMIKKGLLSQETGDRFSIMRKYSDIILSAFKCALHHGAINEDELTYLSIEHYNHHVLVYDAVGRLLSQMKSKKMEMRIIAPKHMLNLDEYDINDSCQAIPKGYEYTAPAVKEWFEKDDPIVQVKVKGGWLNITAWGAEAEHPEVFNETLN